MVRAERTSAGRRVEFVLGDDAVSWADLFYLRLRVGRAVLTCGGIGNVFTRREHRKRGYSRRVLQRCVEAMTADGLDVAMLFGIPDFYHKFGFRASLNDFRFEIPGRAVVDGPAGLAARRIPKARHAEVLPMYARGLRRAGFGVERPSAKWRGYTRGAQFRYQPTVTMFLRGKRRVGYVLVDDDPRAVRVPELFAEDDDVLRRMFTWLGGQCRRKVCEKIELFLSPAHPASRLAVEVGATFTRATHATGGGMMRILNLGGTMARLMPELVARWSASPLADRGLDLALATDLGPAEAVIPARADRAGVVRGRVRLPQDRLIQLVVGYEPAADLARRDGVHIPRSLIPALAALFPERHPAVLATNCF